MKKTRLCQKFKSVITFDSFNFKKGSHLIFPKGKMMLILLFILIILFPTAQFKGVTEIKFVCYCRTSNKNSYE